jgi:DNA-binding MarR family transcriptional regulator
MRAAIISMRSARIYLSRARPQLPGGGVAMIMAATTCGTAMHDEEKETGSAASQSIEMRIRNSIRDLRRRGAHPALQRHVYTIAGRELSPVQVDTLQLLANAPGWRIKDLAKTIGVDPSQGSRIVAGLIELGAAERAIDSNDRRTAIVTATARGRRWDKEIARRLDAMTRDVVQELAPGRQLLLAELLEEYLAAVEVVRERLLRSAKLPKGDRESGHG